MKKLTYDYVKNYIESQGYKLLSKEYVNNGTKLLVRCSQGHEYEVKFGNFKTGKRCPYCAGRYKTISDVKQYVSSFGYTCLSDVYHNARYDKLKIQCDKGHVYKVTWDNFKHGFRCPFCVGKSQLDIDYVRAYIESQNYTLLSETYVSAKNKLIVRCTRGHILETTWDIFSSGSRCYKCRDVVMNAEVLGIEVRKSVYSVHASLLEPIEETRETKEGYLQVRCSNCQKWFIPTKRAVSARYMAINNGGGSRFYCSTECKRSCSIYNRSKYPKGFNTKRPHQTEWANIVKARDNYTCQICGSKDNLVAHHIDPVVCEPIMSADIDNGVTLCSKCHKKVHNQTGCKLTELRNL